MEAIIKGRSFDVKDNQLNYNGQVCVINVGADEQPYIIAQTSEGVFETLTLDAIEVSADPVVIFTEKGCTLSVTVGEYSKSKRRYVRTWKMVSPKTGTHSIDTFTARPDKRVLSHWEGFLANQQ